MRFVGANPDNAPPFSLHLQAAVERADDAGCFFPLYRISMTHKYLGSFNLDNDLYLIIKF
jgi:hypothetical protein